MKDPHSSSGVFPPKSWSSYLTTISPSTSGLSYWLLHTSTPSRKEFAELLDFVREAGFERLGAFEYSEEEGTFGAENYRDSVPKKEKARRLEELMRTQSGISLAFNESRVGNIEHVMVDDYADGVLICRSRYESPEVDGEIVVKYEGQKFGGTPAEDLCGRFIDVRITGADEYDLIAEPV